MHDNKNFISLSLPSSVSLKKKDRYRVIYALKNILGV